MEDPGHAIGYKVLASGTPVVTADGVQIGTAVTALPPYRGVLGTLEHGARRRVARLRRNLGR